MPPIPEALGGDGGWLYWALGSAVLIAALWKPVRLLLRGAKALSEILDDWRGRPERRDDAGRLIEAAKPGVPALLETVRAQVQNDHTEINLRDDLDRQTKRLDDLAEALQGVREDLRIHVAIAKESERRQEDTAQKVAALAARWAADASPRPSTSPRTETPTNEH